jgi:hypothetical protein
METVGKILWILMFLTPLITLPLCWKLLPLNKIVRIVIGLLLAIGLSFILYFVCLAILVDAIRT